MVQTAASPVPPAGPGGPACPICGKPMERGVLAAESFVGGAKWMKERSRLAIGGEPVMKPDAWGNVYFDGYRCPSCKILALSY